MKKTQKFFWLGIFAALVLAVPSCISPDKPVAQYITDLDSSDDTTVYTALEQIRKVYPTSLAAQAKVKTLLADKRINVRRQAVRTIAAVHAEVNETDLNNIAAFLDDKNPQIIIDGLKALRELKAQSMIPRIIPLLQNPNHSVMRDAIRTLSALGDEKLIPTLQPFLTFPDKNVRQDAAYAIELLKTKP